MDEHFDEYHPELIAVLKAFEDKLFSQQEDVEDIALQLLQADKTDLTERFLTYYCKNEANEGLRLASILADSLEVKTKFLFGIRSLPDSLKDRQE